MISIKQCLEALHRGDTVSLEVVTYNKRRPETSGRLLVIESCQLMWGKEADADAPAPSRQPGKAPVVPKVKRNPNHADHFTRNVRVVTNGLLTEIIHKIHPPLIVKMNGQTVCP